MAAITTPEASVIVGAFVLAGTVIQAVINAVGTRKVIGKPNGKGNVIQMLESLLVKHGELVAQHNDLVAEVEVVKQNLLTHMEDVKPKPTVKRPPKKKDS